MLNEVLSLKNRLNEIYSKHTGKSVDEIKSALERDNFMTAEDAKSFGLNRRSSRKKILNYHILIRIFPNLISRSLKL